MPRTIARMSRAKLTREISAADPDLRRLVVCANTLDLMLRLLASDTQTPNRRKSKGPRDAFKDGEVKVVDFGAQQLDRLSLDGKSHLDGTASTYADSRELAAPSGSVDGRREDATARLNGLSESSPGVVGIFETSKEQRNSRYQKSNSGFQVTETILEVGEEDLDDDNEYVALQSPNISVRSLGYDEDSSPSESEEDEEYDTDDDDDDNEDEDDDDEDEDDDDEDKDFQWIYTLATTMGWATPPGTDNQHQASLESPSPQKVHEKILVCG